MSAPATQRVPTTAAALVVSDAAAGFGSHFPGIGPGGTDLLGSFRSAATVAGKVMAAAGAGVCGICLWCLHDMVYLGNAGIGPMRFGLWRYKWAGWYPRPVYHYYAMLCGAFRPGCTFLRVDGGATGLESLAARHASQLTVALLNHGAAPCRVAVRAPWAGAVHRLRVHPALLPAEGDLPVAQEESLAPTGPGLLTPELAPGELTVLRQGVQGVRT